jgi:ATP-dependent exoDNAse (exonuclease V) alpha subunit
MSPFQTWDKKSPPTLPELNEEQQRVLDRCLRDAANGKSLVKVEGPAGSGKTVVLAYLARQFPRDDLCLCARTGKAAGNLAEKAGLPASTIDSAAHKFVRVKLNEKGRPEPVLEDNPDFRPKYLIIDEASMLDRTLGDKLVKRCSGTTFAFGDRGQLGPVKGEPWFDKPDYELIRIMRQGPGSAIIKEARRVRDVGMYGNMHSDFAWAFEEQPELLDADMVICHSNLDRQHFNRKVRERLGFGGSGLHPGEPLMCWRNDRYKSIYNGTIVTVREFWEPGQKLMLRDHRGVDMNSITNPLIEGFGDCADFGDFENRKDQCMLIRFTPKHSKC